MDSLEIVNENSESLLFPLEFSKPLDYEVSLNSDNESYFFIGGPQEDEEIREVAILEVCGYSSCLASPDDIIIRAEDGTVFGVLCLAIGEKLFEVNGMTPARYVSFVMDSNQVQNVIKREHHTFNGSYLLIDKSHIEDYKSNYMIHSPVWGQFTHKPKTTYRLSGDVGSIRMTKGIVFPSDEHENKVHDAIHSSDTFDRFLKKYHLLELIYDWIVVLKLRTMEASIKDFLCTRQFLHH